MKIDCDYCGREFTQEPHLFRRNKHNYCSRPCNFAGRARNRVSIICAQCAKPFRVKKSSATRRRCCSLRCLNLSKSLGRHIDHLGYWRIGKNHEHRIIMEALMGRKLGSNEVVHHIDENRLNNHPENLQMMTRAEHNRLHFAGKPFSGTPRYKINVASP